MEISVTAVELGDAKRIAARITGMMQYSGYTFTSASARKDDDGGRIVSLRFKLREELTQKEPTP